VKNADTRIAAIGKATAAALASASLPADIVPEHGFTSEALLEHPQLALAAGARILIVRGRGGREVMQQTFAARGFSVDTLDVYERVLPALDESRRAEVESHWAAGSIDAVTATSVETLSNLSALLSEQGRQLLKLTPLVVPSGRVRDAAAQMGLCGECLVASGADDESIAGALARWHTRARFPAGRAVQ
jgi:uroporphyrinogen-III synthase